MRPGLGWRVRPLPSSGLFIPSVLPTSRPERAPVIPRMRLWLVPSCARLKKKLLWEFKGEESSRGEAVEVSQKKVGTSRGKLERTK